MRNKYSELLKYGDKFYHLTFIKIESINNKLLGLYLCDCGEYCNFCPSKVYFGNFQNCGCLSRSRKRKRLLKSLGEDYGLSILLGRTSHRCKINKIKINLTLDDLLEVWLRQQRKCFYTGVLLNLPKEGADRNLINQASIDRIDSSVGYTKDNIHFVTKEINFMKFDLNGKEFLSICKLIAERF